MYGYIYMTTNKITGSLCSGPVKTTILGPAKTTNFSPTKTTNPRKKRSQPSLGM